MIALVIALSFIIIIIYYVCLLMTLLFYLVFLLLLLLLFLVKKIGSTYIVVIVVLLIIFIIISNRGSPTATIAWQVHLIIRCYLFLVWKGLLTCSDWGWKRFHKWWVLYHLFSDNLGKSILTSLVESVDLGEVGCYFDWVIVPFDL
jgi:peptidoglycan/LPS O-acetylase OafA/YrhL